MDRFGYSKDRLALQRPAAKKLSTVNAERAGTSSVQRQFARQKPGPGDLE